MSSSTTTEEVQSASDDKVVQQLRKLYDVASLEKDECEAALHETEELILKLEQERETLAANSKNREEEEEEQWVKFQAGYDEALKEKESCEATFKEKDETVTAIENEKEKLMELKTNKETEEWVQSTKWQERYDDAIKEKDEAEFILLKEKERLSELREIQSAYLKKREEEEALMWKDFNERYDAALEEKELVEAALKIKEEEMLALQEEEVSLMHKIAEEQQQQKENGEVGSGSFETGSSFSVGSNIGDIEVVKGRRVSVIKEEGEGEVTDVSTKGEVSAITEPESQHGGGENMMDETHHDHMMAYGDDDDNTSLGATTIASSVSRAMEYKKDLSALDKFLPPKDDGSVVSGMSGRSGRSGRSSRSVSSKSIRRRDVIKPVIFDDDEKKSKDVPVEQEGMVVAKIDDTAEKTSPWALSNHGGNINESDIVEANPQCDQQLALVASTETAMVVHDPKQRAPRLTNLEPEEGRAALKLGHDPPGELPTERPFIDPNDEIINDSTSVSVMMMGREGRFRNVQWCDPNKVQDEDIDFGILEAYERFAGERERKYQQQEQPESRNGSLDQRSVRSMSDPPEDLPKNNQYPEEDECSGPVVHESVTDARPTKASILRDNKRIRIATISSGYKKANYFVREDLDTRIYFHHLEDAVGYMSKRGYAKMNKEDERDWMKLLGKAHGVVKVGPTKKKQRYRKGKLVMILSKEINDIDEDEYKQNVDNCDASDANTERTSLGGSVRCGYKSYSEKFLAEQEAVKQNTLLQLTNGVDVDGAGHLLQLTNGEALSAVDEASLEASNPSLGSDRKGVYGGGVRYFTKDTSMYEESEAQSSDEERFEDDDDDDDDEEEEEESDEEVDEEEESDYISGQSGMYMYEEYAEEEEEEEEEQEEMYEVEGSMGSMFSSEETSFIDQRSAGVDSLSASSTISSGYPAPLQRKSTYREEAPQDGMVRSKF